MLTKSVHIILADDHLVVRAGIRAMIESEPSFVVSGEAANGQEVIDLLNSETPADIILTDMNMPEFSGMQLVDWVSKNRTDLKVVILSAFDDEQCVIDAIRSGACGYLLKTITTRELVFSLRHILNTGIYICAELSSKFFLEHMLHMKKQKGGAGPVNMQFSNREVEILQMIANGYTNQEIADKLFTSVRTIENQRQHMINKTASKNTVMMVRLAMLKGII